MRKTFLSFVISISFCVSLKAQSFTINGYVSDTATKEILIGCAVSGNQPGKGAVTNSFGFYSLKLPRGKVQITYSFLGYEDVGLEFNLANDTTVHVSLKPGFTQLEGIVVKAGKSELENARSGAVIVPVSRIKNSPALLGESDLMKSLQYIPGVHNTAEGKSDLSIRGGSPDQNLILLDGVPVYNANHVFGFLSVFNTDALKNITLYKSGFPARFGGRLSSVIDINTKDGNKENFSGSATLGLLAAKLNFEGPLIKDKTSFTLSARRSYADLFMVKLQDWLDNDDSNDDRTNFFFYDINAKLHHRIGNKTSLYIMAYNGRDKLENKTNEAASSDETSNSATEQNWKWGNTIYATRLNHVITQNLFGNVTLAYNNYKYNTSIDKSYTVTDDSGITEKTFNNLDYDSGIRDYSVCFDLEYIPLSQHYIRTGASFIYHNFRPEAFSRKLSDGNDKDINSQKIHGREFSFYAEDDWDITRKFSINGGFRFSLFNVNQKTYCAVDPRFSMRYMLTRKLSLKAGYTHMQQYIHLLSNNSLLLQTDLWVPATDKINPMNSKQYSAGFDFALSDLFDISLDGYYKDMRNMIEYKDGASFTGVSTGWEDKVEAGTGRSYGIEFSSEKKHGKTTGILSYALAKTERKFNEINYEEWFPAKFDRRHNLNMNINHKINKRIDFMLNWIYVSGDMVTIPMMSIEIADIPDTRSNDVNVAQLDHRNNYRMAASRVYDKFHFLKNMGYKLILNIIYL